MLEIGQEISQSLVNKHSIIPEKVTLRLTINISTKKNYVLYSVSLMISANNLSS